MEIIDYVCIYYVGVVIVLGVSGIFFVYSYSDSSFIQLYGVGCKGDWDIQICFRFQRDVFGVFEKEIEN